MRFFSFLISLHGLIIIYDSVIRIYTDENFKFGHLILESNYNYIGLLLGVALIFSGIGIFLKRKYGYYITLFIYSILILYGFVGLSYIIVVDGFDLIPIILILIIISAFYLLIRYIKSNKEWFNF